MKLSEYDLLHPAIVGKGSLFSLKSNSWCWDEVITVEVKLLGVYLTGLSAS